MSENYIKRSTKWGLLRRIVGENKPWHFVNDARWIFEHKEDASQAAIDLMTKHPERAVQEFYKPVAVEIAVEVDEGLLESKP